MDDSRIIDLFFERSERAITELSNKYGALCMSISLGVLGDIRDAEECVNDAYLGVWNAIPPQRPHPLSSFVCRIVRNISINRYKQKSAEKRKGNYDLCIDELQDVASAVSDPQEECEAMELAGHIDAFLGTLSKTDRGIFVRRFWYLDGYDAIATAFGLSEGAVRTRISRIKAKLKNYLRELS